MSNGTIFGNYATKGGPSSNKAINAFADSLVKCVELDKKVRDLKKQSKVTDADYNSLYAARSTVVNNFIELSCADMREAGSTGLVGGEAQAEKYTAAINFINDTKNQVGKNIAKLLVTTPDKINCIIGGYNSQTKTKVPPLDVDKITDSIFTELSTPHRVAETCLGRVLIISLVIVGLLCLLFLGLFISSSKKLKQSQRNSFSR